MLTETTSKSVYPLEVIHEAGKCRGCQTRNKRNHLRILAIQCKIFHGKLLANWLNEISSNCLTPAKVREDLTDFRAILADEDWKHSLSCQYNNNSTLALNISDIDIQYIASAMFPLPYEVEINGIRHHFQFNTDEKYGKHSYTIKMGDFVLLLSKSLDSISAKLIVPKPKEELHHLVLKQGDEILHNSIPTHRSFAANLDLNTIYTLEVNDAQFTLQFQSLTSLQR